MALLSTIQLCKLIGYIIICLSACLSVFQSACLSVCLSASLSVLCITCGCLQARIVEALLGFEVTAISCGTSHVFAVTIDHEVFSWGRGDNGVYALIIFVVYFSLVNKPLTFL